MDIKQQEDNFKQHVNQVLVQAHCEPIRSLAADFADGTCFLQYINALLGLGLVSKLQRQYSI